MRLDTCGLLWREDVRLADENIHDMDKWYKQDAANSAKWDACLAKARLDFEHTNPPSNSMRLLIVIAMDLVLIGFGWLIVWGCVALVKWVRRGFVAP
jgi:hypothetical protein